MRRHCYKQCAVILLTCLTVCSLSRIYAALTLQLHQDCLYCVAAAPAVMLGYAVPHGQAPSCLRKDGPALASRNMGIV